MIGGVEEMVKKEQTPKRRFREFKGDGEWEADYLGIFADITTGKLDANSMVEGGGYDFYTSGIKKYKIDKAAFTGPAITIAGNGATVGYMHLADGDFNAYQRTYVLNNFRVDRLFLFSEVSNKLPKKVTEEVRSGNIPYIVMDMLVKLEVTLPRNKNEQQKIGVFFSKLDSLIDLHKQKMDKLKNMKSAYLVEIFPVEGAVVPKRRFAGFTGEWEKKYFIDIFEYTVASNTLSRALLSYEESQIKNIHYGDILVKYDSIVNVTKDQIPFVINGNLVDFKGQFLKNGDIVFADTAEDETVGKVIEVVGIDQEHIVAGLHTIVARTNIDFAPYYLGYYLNSQSYRKQLLKFMQGIKVLSLSKGNLSKTMILFPQDIEEQQKIGEFLQQLDSQISLHQNKLEKLQNLKQAYLNEMFV